MLFAKGRNKKYDNKLKYINKIKKISKVETLDWAGLGWDALGEIQYVDTQRPTKVC